jgi:hypothetical protein
MPDLRDTYGGMYHTGSVSLLHVIDALVRFRLFFLVELCSVAGLELPTTGSWIVEGI